MSIEDPSILVRQAPSDSQPDGNVTYGFDDFRGRQVSFDRTELNIILGVYGIKVAAGEWRDYAMDFTRDMAIFSVFRRASEVPLYRIVKDPKLARKQGLYSVVAQGGLILKRGQDLAQVLRVLIKKPKLVSV